MVPVTNEDPLRLCLAAALEGDDAAVAQLVRHTQPIVWRVCAALGSPDNIEDLVQDTYLRALASLSSYRGESSVQSWLLAIARNVCADDVRRRQRRRRLHDRLTKLTTSGDIPPPDPIIDLLDELTPEQREAFVLTQLAGLRYEEAADVAGCPIGTIRSRVARARAQLIDSVRRTQTR
jgi:RNA polymerase sigma-70 factor, ECF subfamily